MPRLKRSDMVTVEEWEDDTYWIYLRPGFVHVDGEHAIAEDSVADARRKLLDVKRCECEECQRLVLVLAGQSRVFS